MKKSNILSVFIFVLIAPVCLAAVPLKVAKIAVEETLELAAKKSGKILAPAAKKTAEKALREAVLKYGDDALKAVKNGGLEALEQGSKYGDDFWKLCKNASPAAVRSLSLHADELLPLVKRCGSDFLALEGKVPGLGAKTVEVFGDSAVQTFKNAPASHITQMLGFARKADSPETVKLLHKGYAQSAGKILDHLNWKHIMAGGLSAAAILAAYRTTGAVQTLAETNPGLLLGSFYLWGFIIAAVIIIIICIRFRRFLKAVYCLFRGKTKQEKSQKS